MTVYYDEKIGLSFVVSNKRRVYHPGNEETGCINQTFRHKTIAVVNGHLIVWVLKQSII